MLEILRTDFQRLPGLLALDAPPQPEPEEREPVVEEPELALAVADRGGAPGGAPEEPEGPGADQLGLF
jgi:hypothetical protein